VLQKIFIDIGFHQPATPDGLSRYSSALIAAIKKVGKSRTIILIERKDSTYRALGKYRHHNLIDLLDENSIVLFPSLDVNMPIAIDYLVKMKLKSSKFHFLVADLIAIDYPELFNRGVGNLVDWYITNICELADLIIVPTVTVKEKVIEYLVLRGHQFPDILVGAPGIDHIPVKKISNSKNLVVIGTIEPRKQNLLIAKAFLESGLVSRGFSLTFAGKLGWLSPNQIEEFMSLCVKHSGLSFKENPTDSDLFELIASSCGLLQYSLDEGYGLTVIEAAYYKKPVFVRDIPIFRETTKSRAYFSSHNDPKQLGLDLFRFATATTVEKRKFTPTIDKNQDWKKLALIWLGSIGS
jgi:glycosyltransferase involved in cell wall biosynthesis